VDNPRTRNRWVVILLALVPCVALVSCLGGGMAVVAFDGFVEGIHPDAEVDALRAAIRSGDITIGADHEAVFLTGGHACPTWGPFQSGGHEFMAWLFRDDSRSITVYFMDEKVIAAQGHALMDGHRADHWFFIDLDKFNAYIDANTGGRFTRSAPLTDPAPAD
jgi:hypothetical protein